MTIEELSKFHQTFTSINNDGRIILRLHYMCSVFFFHSLFLILLYKLTKIINQNYIYTVENLLKKEINVFKNYTKFLTTRLLKDSCFFEI